MSLRAVVGGLGALLVLAGCGTAHPGAAAIVDGQEITLSHVDDVSSELCTVVAEAADRQEAEIAAAEEAGQQIPPGEDEVQRQRQGEIRASVVETLVRQVAFERILAEEGIEIAYDEYRVPPDDVEVYEEVYDDADLILPVVEAADFNVVAVERIAQAWDIEIQTQEDFEVFLRQVADHVDINIDPRFGIENDLVRTGSRSVSVEVPSDDEPDETDPLAAVAAGDDSFPRPEVTVGRLC